MSDSEPGTVREGTLLLVAGILIPFAVAASVILNSLPHWVVSAGMILWIIWFTKWSVQGGMPRMGGRV